MTQSTRTERDALGAVEVPAERYWGAQTQRSLRNFAIGWERMPTSLIRALARVKEAAAMVNQAQGDLAEDLAKAIRAAARE